MKNILYLEGASGISGDMTVAALLDLGGNQEKLLKVLESLQLGDEFHCHIKPGESYSIAGCSFNVHCHNEHACEHHHDHSHDHHHNHHHDHDHHHEHIHRNLSDVTAVIRRADMTENARNLAIRIFEIVAAAEARAHGCSIEDVHFHEVGAIDSIVDIVAAAVLIDDLGIDECIVESLTEGSGTVRCQHGILPVPVPAVLNIAAAHNIVLKKSSTVGEMVTPTGIAIAAALQTSDKLPERYRVKKVGTGVGKRDFGHANILRAMLIENVDRSDRDQIFVLESNIDDSTGEQLGLLQDKLLKAGALDVTSIPCFMKKNRPAYQLKVIAAAEGIDTLEYIIFAESSTIGIRRYPVERSCMQREIVELPTVYGTVLAKKCSWLDIERIYPEFESVKALAEKNNTAFSEVLAAARSACCQKK